MKIVLMIAMILMMGSISSANIIGISVDKIANGDYDIEIPVYMDAQAQLPFLPKAYCKVSQHFSLARAGFGNAVPNHSRVDVLVGSQITLFGALFAYETGFTAWQKGNSAGMPEMIEGNNKFKFYWNW